MNTDNSVAVVLEPAIIKSTDILPICRGESPCSVPVFRLRREILSTISYQNTHESF
jgi:hypothetical protein